MIIGLIGDVHNDVMSALRPMEAAAEAGAALVVLMGDVGYGREAADELIKPLRRDAGELGIAIAAIEGNHDRPHGPGERDGYEAWVGDDVDLTPGSWTHLRRGTRFVLDGVAFVATGGAASIDRNYRGRRMDWWPTEVLAEADVAAHLRLEPADVWLTHDAVGLPPGVEPAGDDDYRGRLATQTERMGRVRAHLKPLLHVHGHWHQAYEATHVLDGGWQVRTIGLAADGRPGSLHIIDTERL